MYLQGKRTLTKLSYIRVASHDIPNYDKMHSLHKNCSKYRYIDRHIMKWKELYEKTMRGFIKGWFIHI